MFGEIKNEHSKHFSTVSIDLSHLIPLVFGSVETNRTQQSPPPATKETNKAENNEHNKEMVSKTIMALVDHRKLVESQQQSEIK